jgi:hypothetical protein
LNVVFIISKLNYKVRLNELFMRVMQAANVGQESAYFGQIVPLWGKLEKGYELGKKVGRFLSFFCPLCGNV